MLIYSGVFKNAEENPQKVCMIFGERKITYGELVESINKRAIFLAGKYTMGEKIVIGNMNPFNTIINFLACSRAGLISIPVNPKTSSCQMDEIMKKVNASFIMDDRSCFDLDKEGENLKLPHIEDSYIFLGALSSGTTGHSKIIWRDHKSWTSAFKYQSEVFHISRKDVLFLAGYLSYTANLNSALHILNEGGSIVFSKSIYPRTWIKEMKQNDVTSIFMVPAHYRILLKELGEDLDQIRSVLSAGDKLDEKTACKLKNRFSNAHICEYYGASELGHVAYMDFTETYREGCVGKAFPQVKFWLENNLIWVKSPYIAPNFRPKATVGDIGKIDGQGNLYVLGRKNNTINKGGVKILPYNIEKVLNNHPSVLKSVVFGIKHPVKGEETGAVILSKDDTLTEKYIREYCKTHLKPYLQPRKIRIVKNFKLNSNGKIDMNAL
ncbi:MULTISPECIES: class I adenylate-forming enzyme family protein [Clostridium]|uniref:Class I adenylate-forming enzyme family protein n=1 Tax=Clostridium lapidicellarium TaxID=3240931 RepID=A0ABV4DYB2_9CLOT|nr:AMP-binding protein [uncultured Clostridium sp.]